MSKKILKTTTYGLNWEEKEGLYTFIGTGMATIDEIETAVEVFKKYNCPFELMHCVSAYPLQEENENLLIIKTLKHKFNCHVGYSGHEFGELGSVLAVAGDATSIERHITLDRTMYGSGHRGENYERG